MKDALIVSLLSITPRKTGARSMGWLARTGVSRLITRVFVTVYGLDMSEAAGDLHDYPTLEALFTRELKPGVRPVADAPRTMVSPADGAVAFVGPSADGHIELHPGRHLDLSMLVGEPVQDSDVAVIYLSPKDYHRVHNPFEGTATRWRYIPGTLWPVFPAAVRRIANLFALNERVAVWVDTDHGPLVSVLVGAFGVGRISLAFADLLTNTGARDVRHDPSCNTPVERGEHLGTFHLGSTVVLLAPADTWTWTIHAGDSIKMGQPISRAES